MATKNALQMKLSTSANEEEEKEEENKKGRCVHDIQLLIQA